MRISLRGAVPVAALVASLLVPAGASADSPLAPTVVTFGGSPLTVMVGSRGELQAQRSGETGGIFFPSSRQFGDAGFFLAFPPVTASPPAPAQPTPLSGRVFGFNGAAGPFIDDEYVPAAPTQAPATGDGSPANPFTQVTSYSARADMDEDENTGDTDVATITQTTTYVSGAETFTVRWDVKNVAATPLRFKALAAADFYFEGSDRGTGIFTEGPPRFVGGTNADTGRSGGFVEIPEPAPYLPWSHYQALAFTDASGNDVWTRLEAAGDAVTPSYDDTVVGNQVDNAGAVEWDQYLEPTRTLPAGGVATFALIVRTALPAALQFDQTNAGAPQGVPIAFKVTARDTANVPFAGRQLVSKIDGVNPGTQTTTIAADGTATVTDPGTNAGNDTVVSFVDFNANGTREPSEPQGSALATFVDKTPPTCQVKVSGDRVGSGGAGKPLVITVNCDSPATVTTASTLTVTPPARKVTHKKARKSAVDAAKKKRKPKAKKKPKPVVVKLPPSTTQVQPGQALPVSIAIPASVTKKYPGATAVATVTVTATDSAGNVATTKATKKVTLAKPKAKKAKPKHKKKKRR